MSPPWLPCGLLLAPAAARVNGDLDAGGQAFGRADDAGVASGAATPRRVPEGATGRSLGITAGDERARFRLDV